MASRPIPDFVVNVAGGIGTGRPADLREVADFVRMIAAEAANEELAEFAAPDAIDGDQRPLAQVLPQLFNGGVGRVDAAGRAMGVTIPAGQTGVNSLIQLALPLEGSQLTGCDLGVSWQIDTSASFDRVIGITIMVRTAAGAEISRPSTEYARVTAQGRTTITQRYPVQGDEVQMRAFLQITGGAVAASEQWLMVSGVAHRVLASPDLLTPDDKAGVVTRARERSRTIAAVLAGTSTVVTVKPSGGDYATPAAALAAITDASAGKGYVVRIWPNTTSDKSWPCNELTMKRFVDLEGVGPDRVWLKGYQAANSAPGLGGPITINSTVRWSVDAKMTNLRVTAQNMRYAVHADDPQMIGATLACDNCSIEHLGNEEARQYQISQGHDPDTYGGVYFVWTSVCAWGSGTYPNGRMLMRNTIFRSPNGPFLAHNTNDEANNPPKPQPAPAYIELDGCIVESLATTDPVSVILQGFGTGQTDVCQIVRTKLVGPIGMSSQRTSEKNWLVTGGGNVGLSFIGNAVRSNVAV